MRQILYVSESTVPGEAGVLETILHQSRHNNGLDGVTGLLWSDGRRFAQVIEGDDRAIADVMARIRADRRHHRIEVLRDEQVTEREFGSWSMDWRSADGPADTYDARLSRMLSDSSDAVRSAFGSLIAA